MVCCSFRVYHTAPIGFNCAPLRNEEPCGLEGRPSEVYSAPNQTERCRRRHRLSMWLKLRPQMEGPKSCFLFGSVVSILVYKEKGRDVPRSSTARSMFRTYLRANAEKRGSPGDTRLFKVGYLALVPFLATEGLEGGCWLETDFATGRSAQLQNQQPWPC